MRSLQLRKTCPPQVCIGWRWMEETWANSKAAESLLRRALDPQDGYFQRDKSPIMILNWFNRLLALKSNQNL